ncbi:hypothetical protein IWX78_001971 [Mycetocola sp. CAN_C7]|uniref:hypothetical protein n=1 Tax=Mycetocola sp. CAN_C7 TaxID=2787724 RepID=UPI0018C905CF
MSAPEGSGRSASYPYMLVLFAVVLYFALVVCAFGFVSLLTDTDVVDASDAGPLVGPAATGSAVLTVLFFLIGIARQYEHDLRAAVAGAVEHPVRLPLGRSVLIGAVSFAAYVLVGAILYAVTTGELFSAVLFAADSTLSGYALVAGILAAAVAVIYMIVLATGGEHPARPLWPWER